jgi:hypothetical protein
LKPHPENKAKTQFVYMNHTDLGGWFPGFLVNALNPKISVDEIEHIKKICEKKT